MVIIGTLTFLPVAGTPIHTRREQLLRRKDKIASMKDWEIIADNQQSRMELGLRLGRRFRGANNLDC
jgi:hypothetical protein